MKTIDGFCRCDKNLPDDRKYLPLIYCVNHSAVVRKSITIPIFLIDKCFAKLSQIISIQALTEIIFCFRKLWSIKKSKLQCNGRVTRRKFPSPRPPKFSPSRPTKSLPAFKRRQVTPHQNHPHRNTFLIATFHLGFKGTCAPGEPGGNFVGLDTLPTIPNDDQMHFLASQQQQFSQPEEQEYQALEPGQQSSQYMENSPEFYTSTNLLESKYHPQSFVKNYVRGKSFLFVSALAHCTLIRHVCAGKSNDSNTVSQKQYTKQLFSLIAASETKTIHCYVLFQCRSVRLMLFIHCSIFGILITSKSIMEL